MNHIKRKYPRLYKGRVHLLLRAMGQEVASHISLKLAHYSESGSCSGDILGVFSKPIFVSLI